MIVIKVTAMPASTVGRAIQDARDLARNLNVCVELTFNKVVINVCSTTDVHKATANYLKKLRH